MVIQVIVMGIDVSNFVRHTFCLVSASGILCPLSVFFISFISRGITVRDSFYYVLFRACLLYRRESNYSMGV